MHRTNLKLNIGELEYIVSLKLENIIKNITHMSKNGIKSQLIYIDRIIKGYEIKN